MYRSNSRNFSASIYLDELPDKECWSHLVDSAERISGSPDTTYTKGCRAVVTVPDDCGYWADESKLIVMSEEARLCGNCHSLLRPMGEALICEECWTMYPKE